MIYELCIKVTTREYSLSDSKSERVPVEKLSIFIRCKLAMQFSDKPAEISFERLTLNRMC